MKPGPIPGVNIAHNTASGGYLGGELVDDPLRRAGPSTLRTTRYRRFSHGWGCYPRLAGLRHSRDSLFRPRERLHVPAPRTGGRRPQDPADPLYGGPAPRPGEDRAV